MRLGGAVSVIRLLFSFGLVGLTWVIILLWYNGYTTIENKLPPVVSLLSLTIATGENLPERVILGRTQLLQNKGGRAAAESHLIIQRKNDKIFVSNAAENRQLGLTYSKFGYLNSNNRLISVGDVFFINGKSIRFTAIASETITYSIDGQKPKTAGVYEKCGASFLPRNLLTKFTRGSGRTCIIERFGGYSGGSSLPEIEEAPADIARILFRDKAFFVSTKSQYFVEYCPKNSICTNAYQVDWPIRHPMFGKLQKLTMGRTSYRVFYAENSIKLKTVSRPHWVDETRQNRQSDQADRFTPNSSILRRSLTASLKNRDGGLDDAFWSVNPGNKGIWLLLLAIIGFAFIETKRNSKNFAGHARVANADWHVVLWAILIAIGIYLCLNALPPNWPIKGQTPGQAALATIALLLLLSARNTIMQAGIGLLIWIGITPLKLHRWFKLISRRRYIPGMALAGAFLAAMVFWQVPSHGLVTMAAIVTIWFIAVLVETIRFCKGRPKSNSSLDAGHTGIALDKQHASTTGIDILSVIIAFTILYFIPAFDTANPTDTDLLMPDYHRPIGASILLHGLAGTAIFMRKNWRLSTALVWFSYLLLALFGHLNAIQLTFSGPYAQFVALFEKHNWGLSFIALVLITASGLTARALHRFVRNYLTGERESPPIYGALSMLTVSALLVWAAVGGETGIFGVQPSEFGKSLIIILFSVAAVISLRAERIGGHLFSVSRIMAPVGLFLVLAGAFILPNLLLSDLSPILISYLGLALLTATILLFTSVWSLFGSFVSSIPFAIVVVFGIFASTQIFTDLSIGAKLTQVFGSLILLTLVLTAFQIIRWILRAGRNERLGLSRQEAPRDLSFRAAIGSPWQMANYLHTQIGKVFRKPVQILAGLAILSIVIAGYSIIQLSNNESKMAAGEVYLPNPFIDVRVPDVPIERLLSWRDMNSGSEVTVIRFPDLAQQVVQSRRLLSQSGCGLSDFANWVADPAGSSPGKNNLLVPVVVAAKQYFRNFPGCSQQKGLRLGTADTKALAVPAIQDDFIASFFGYTFGRDAVVVIAFVQFVIFISLLFLSAQATKRATSHPREFEVCLFFSFTTAGFAFGLLLQFALSWANVFGLLPVMGQPMSLLSLGTSHLLFFVLPAIVLALLADFILGAPDHASPRGISEARLSYPPRNTVTAEAPVEPPGHG